MESLFKHIKGIKIPQLPIHIELIGHLIYFEGPLMSVYADKNGLPYILDWVEKSNNCNRWLLYSIEKYMLADYINGKATHFQLVNNPNNDLIYVLDKDINGEIVNCIICTPKSIPYEYLPAIDIVFEEEDSVKLNNIKTNFKLEEISNLNVGNDVFDILSEAKKSENELINLHIKSSNRKVGYGKIYSSVLGKVLSGYHNLSTATALNIYDEYNNIPKEERPRRKKGELKELMLLAENEFVYVRAASFSVFLRPIKQIHNLFDAQTSSEKIASKVFELFTASTNTESLNQIKSTLTESVLNTYNQFLKEIKENDITIELQYANPQNSTVLKESFGPGKAQKILSNLSTLEFENNYEEKLVGTFMALDLTNQTFKFESNDEEIFSGKFANTLFQYIHQFNLIDTYSVSILVLQSKKSGKKKVSEKDVMISCYNNDENKYQFLGVNDPKLLE